MTTGVPNSPMVITKASTAPDKMAGATNGRVIVVAVRNRLRPETWAASSRLGSMLRSAAATIIIT